MFTMSLYTDTDPFPPGVTWVSLHVDPWEIAKNRPVEVGILGDPKATLAEFLRVGGGLLRREGATAALDNAEALYLQAIDQARRQDALSWELRASTDLAQLYEDQGRAGAARSTVAPVYARFTQGFETADLKAARTLLERLR